MTASWRSHHRGAIAVVLGLVLAIGVAACGSDDEPATAPGLEHDTAASDTHDGIDPDVFRQDMRALWEQHVAWTRLFIVSAVAGAPDTQATADRLLRNQDDIGEAIAPFYGEAAGAQLTELLRTHITLAADLLTAAKSGDGAALTTAKDDWYVNADDVATFLAQANPEHWPLDVLTQMMRTHLDQTLAEATAQLTGDYAGSIAEYDHIEEHILEMADALADGINAQFPERFAA